MNFWKTAFWAVCAGGVAFTASASINFYAHATATETNVFLGQVFNLDVVVKAPAKPNAPDPLSPDFNITLLDTGKATSQTNTWLYRYAFRAKREGELHIPELKFDDLYTKPIAIKANKPKMSDRMRLETSISKTSVYLGEPVRLTTTWDSTYPFGALKAVDFHFPVLNDKRFKTMDLYEPEKEKDSQTTGLPVHGTRVLATRKSYMVEEVQHQSLSFSRLLIPQKTGKLAVPPSTLLCAAEKNPDSKQGRRSAFQYPAYFDNTFFDQNLTGGTYARIYTESTPVILDVKPLPAEGRPSLFSGWVGDYTLAVAAEPTVVHVGEPVTLTITITAAGFMENISFPPLRHQPLLLNRFAIPSERSLAQRSGKSKIYTQTIRPLSTTLSQVPPIQLAYFSPTSNAYITVQSDPIPLRVSPAKSITTFGMEGVPLRAAKKEIRHDDEHPDRPKSQRLPWFGWAHWALLFIFLLLLVVGGIWLASLFGKKKHHIHRTAKAARAYKIYRKNAAHIIHSHTMKSEIYGDLDQVLRAYLGDRLHLNPGALTFRDAERRLVEAGAEAQTLEELKTLFALCEAYRFTNDYNDAADAKLIVHNASRIVKAIEGHLK